MACPITTSTSWGCRSARPTLSSGPWPYAIWATSNFATGNRIAGLDEEESFGEYLERPGVTKYPQPTLRGCLEMTIVHVEFSGDAQMRTYLAEMLLPLPTR